MARSSTSLTAPSITAQVAELKPWATLFTLAVTLEIVSL
jgi:hypothetical protein